MPEEFFNAIGSSEAPPKESAEPGPPLCETGKRVRRRDILNLLNFINFSDGIILAEFRHLEQGNRLTFQASPRPCNDDVLDCSWAPPGISLGRLKPYVCEGFLLCDGSKSVAVKAEVTRLDEEGITFKIPESGCEKSSRTIERHPCEGVEATIIQAGLRFGGKLVDFNAFSFKVELESSAAPEASFRWINRETAVTVQFSHGDELLYSGECRIGRMDKDLKKRILVLAPSSTGIHRYKAKKYRNERYALSPSPVLHFLHPLTGKAVDLQVKNISGTGIGVQESLDRSVLVPGLVIPQLSIEIANQTLVTCKAQVLYRNGTSMECDEEDSVSCGLAFLDLDMLAQVRLSAYLHQSVDDRLRVCGKVEIEDLWRFFFETGFIYPSKYRSIEARKQEFRQTYEKLYRGGATVALYFIYQDMGRIFGHISMLRFYSNSWIFQHHAASSEGKYVAGVKVLEQAMRYINHFHSHPSTHMDYLLCYFREDNRFPARVFGNIARDIANPKGASMDCFAYLRLSSDEGDDAESFQLFPAGEEDYEDLGRYYEKISGGLALDALDLRGDRGPNAELSAEYLRQGFKRERQVFCLKLKGKLKAVISLTLSDLGLNLSDLTNCIHVFVLDPEGLHAETLRAGLRALLRRFGDESFPILAFPCDYLDDNAIPYEKKYILWAASLEYTDSFASSIRCTFRRTCRDSDDGQISDR